MLATHVADNHAINQEPRDVRDLTRSSAYVERADRILPRFDISEVATDELTLRSILRDIEEPTTVLEFPSLSSLSSRILSLSEAASRELDHYLTLPPGWDGYTAPSFDRDTVFLSKRLLNRISSHLVNFDFFPDEITPGPISDGALDLEIAKDDRRFTLTIVPNKEEVLITTESADGYKEKPVELRNLNLEKELSWLNS